MRIKQRVCDFCGQPMNRSGDLIIKKSWACWWDLGWERLDVCVDCAKKIMIFIEQQKQQEKK